MKIVIYQTRHSKICLQVWSHNYGKVEFRMCFVLEDSLLICWHSNQYLLIILKMCLSLDVDVKEEIKNFLSRL